MHRNFKLCDRLDGLLKKEAAKTKRTQTAIVEIALAEYFAVKR